MKVIHITIWALAMLLCSSSWGIGLNSKELVWPCTGEVQLTKIKRLGSRSGFYDRAENWHPPEGYAVVEINIIKLSEACKKMEEELNIDFSSKSFDHYFFFNTTDKEQIKQLASLKLGETHQFNAKQHFLFMDKDGYLPFFPLIHFESVSLRSSSISLQGSYSVNVEEVYGISLSEDDEVLLSELVFQYLERQEKNGLYLPSVVNAMFENYPKRDHLKAFLVKALEYYREIEKSSDNSENSELPVNWMLSALSSNIRELTHRHPAEFDIPSLLLHHPSLVNYSSWYSDKATCPDVSAIQLEQTLELLEEALTHDSLHPNVKKRWEKALHQVYGSYSCFSQAASQLAKSTAIDLLKKYY